MKRKTKRAEIAAGQGKRVRLCFTVDCVVSSEQSTSITSVTPTKWKTEPGKPPVLLSTDGPIIVPGLIDDFLTLSVVINDGRPFFRNAMASAPAQYKDNLENWPDAVARYIEKWFPVRLEGLMDELLSAVNAGETPDTPNSMTEPNQADTRKRLEKREKRLRARQIPSPAGRPHQGKERLRTRQRLLTAQKELIADIRKYKEEYRRRRTYKGDHGIKTYVARKIYHDKISNPLQQLRRRLKPTGSSFESI